MLENWSPDSWRGLPIRQVPGYSDEAALGRVEETLHRFPPLVFAGEARRLKERLAAVAAGKGVFLPGGGWAGSLPGIPPHKKPPTFKGRPPKAGGLALCGPPPRRQTRAPPAPLPTPP